VAANTAPKLILASASPRRRELLKAAGFDFEVLPASLPEVARIGESPEEFVRRMAQEKAEAVWRKLPQPRWHPVLAADTVVVLGNQLLGKPADADQAREMLQALSGNEHRVLTGLCLVYLLPQGPAIATEPTVDVRVASTVVKFSKLTELEIQEYVASGEPLDKAGAYAIQGRASKYVEWVRGCYFNVVGLPVSLLYRMLREAHLIPQ